jgi:phage anti-repressor protein
MGEQVHGGHNRIDYTVSLECAKHISMMENTDRGRYVRQYFIDFEKAAAVVAKVIARPPVSKTRTLPEESVAPAPTFSIVVKDGPMGVDLRDLHQELESKRQFGNWADEKLSQFVKGEDFEEVFNNPVKNSVGRPRKDYVVSIEVAKHIAMMENTERGKQVRRYFIECEKALKGLHSPTTQALPQTRIEALRELADQLERNEALALINTEQSNLIEEQAPKVEFFDPSIHRAGGLRSA